MNSKVYKWCAVPLCRNTSIATPNKVFVHVPNKKNVRDKWLKLARRNPADVVTNSTIYFCEDHFDLPNDMENYMQYHVMGSVAQVRTIPGCIPKKFDCQQFRKMQTFDTIQPYKRKTRKMMVLEECEKQLEESSMATASGSSETLTTLKKNHQPKSTLKSTGILYLNSDRIENDKLEEIGDEDAVEYKNKADHVWEVETNFTSYEINVKCEVKDEPMDYNTNNEANLKETVDNVSNFEIAEKNDDDFIKYKNEGDHIWKEEINFTSYDEINVKSEVDDKPIDHNTKEESDKNVTNIRIKKET